MEKIKVRTRIAPSPTGSLHVGTARAALFNELYARQNKGSLVVRIEDTDQKRSKKSFEKEILAGLQWLGLKWDEGPDIGGSFGPYRQSERTTLYHQAVEQLLDSGAAYEKENAIKLKVEPQKISFTDLIRGQVTTHSDTWGGDFVIARSSRDPVYHLAVVVDDAAQEITHVIRGEDHLANTARHILLQRALGLKQPQYAHLPLLLDETRRKLSKRAGDTSILAFKKNGYLPQAMFNYLALLGWNPKNDEEFFTHEKLIKCFSLQEVQKGGAIFDPIKLASINKHYLSKISESEKSEWEYEYARQYIKDHKLSKEDLNKVSLAVKTERGRAASYANMAEYISWVRNDWKLGANGPELLGRKGQYERSNTRDNLKKIEGFMEKNEEHIDEKDIEEKVLAWIDDGGLGRGDVLWPIRVALVGREHSPGPFAVSSVLGKKEVLKRLAEAIKLLV